MRSWRWDRALVMALYAAVVASVVGPVVLTLWLRIRHDGAWPVAVRQWLIGQGYLPWQAWIALDRYPPLVYGFLIAGGGVVLAFAIWAGFTRRPAWGGPPTAGQGQHGTARWRSAWETRQTLGRWEPKRMNQADGLVVGQGQGQTAWVVTEDGHALVIGATRSGKGRRVILPTIGLLGTNRRSSLLITDPKGELFAHSAEFLRDQGYAVRRVDFRDPRLGMQFNPLDPVAHALHQSRDWTRASQVAWDIAHVLSDQPQVRGDPFWSQAQEALIAGLILAVADRAPASCRHLASVYTCLVEAGRKEGKALDEWMATFPEEHPARLAYGSVQLSSERTRASILTGAATALRLWADPDIAWLTADASFAMDALADRPEAHFLIIPDDRATRYPIVTLYLTLAIQALTLRAQREGGRLPRPVHFLLDEVGNLPAIPDLDKTIAVAAGRGMRMTLVLQDLQQLRSRYGEAAGTIQANTATWVYLITQDWETAQLLSKKMGDYTTEVRSLSHPQASWWRYASTATGSVQESHALTGRPLLTPDEIMRWPQGQALVLQTRLPPVRLRLPDLTAWSVFRALHRPAPAEEPIHGVEPVERWWPGKTDNTVPVQETGLIQAWARSRSEESRRQAVPDW